MSELDELVSRDGVFVAGRFGPDWRIAEQKTVPLFLESPTALEMLSNCCASIHMMFNVMAVGMSDVAMSDAAVASWQPVKGWAVSTGDYLFGMYGDRFMLAESKKLGSIDELLDLLRR